MRVVLKKEKHKKGHEKKPIDRKWLFPVAVIALYGILFFFSPDTVCVALSSSGNVFVKILFPLSLVFILLLALNVFLKPGHIVKYIGRGAGMKGVFLSVTSGIISMGPIYAWYPLLRDLREKGADTSFIAIFLGNRAVKPFLLPVMISYFGWKYALLLIVFTCIGSVAAGYTVGFFVKEDGRQWKNS